MLFSYLKWIVETRSIETSNASFTKTQNGQRRSFSLFSAVSVCTKQMSRILSQKLDDFNTFFLNKGGLVAFIQEELQASIQTRPVEKASKCCQL